jgi:Zn-dependent peptidase ImmA (M78 family)
MLKKVPYLYEEQIERHAAVLLAEFEQARGIVIKRHVPIEDIVEKHLKLGIEFDDMHWLFNHPRSGLNRDPDILGAMLFHERRIVIDESLDPEENPSMEGRYRFTLAHEVGHWRLHRHLSAGDSAQFALAPPSIFCRWRAQPLIEWQADCYASCLLMPRKLVMAAWDEMFPDRKPRVVRPRTAINRLFEWQIWDQDCSEIDDNVLDLIARPLAEQFLVSPIAMRIRLEKLRLLRREVPHRCIRAA